MVVGAASPFEDEQLSSQCFESRRTCFWAGSLGKKASSSVAGQERTRMILGLFVCLFVCLFVAGLALGALEAFQAGSFMEKMPLDPRRFQFFFSTSQVLFFSCIVDVK